MVLEYDTNPNLTIDQKLDSLIHNLQLALDELGIGYNNNAGLQSGDLSTVQAEINAVREIASSAFASASAVDARVTTIDEAITIINATLESLDARVTALENPTP